MPEHGLIQKGEGEIRVIGSEVEVHSDRIGRNQSDRVRSRSSFGQDKEKSEDLSPNSSSFGQDEEK